MVRPGFPTPSTSFRIPLVGVALFLLTLITACGGEPRGAEAQAGKWTTEGASPTASTFPRTSGGQEQADTTAARTPPESGPRSPAAAPTKFAVVGDSITAGTLPLEGTTVLGSNSWIPSAKSNPRLEFIGGWAVPGATTTDMLSGVAPIAADVLVVMAGTNDVAEGAAWPVIESNLLQIGATAEASTVLLSAVPPQNTVPTQTQLVNENLEQLARNCGWTFVDPWADMSTEGTWMAETSDDGIHPNEQVAALVGSRLAAAIAAVD